MIKFCRAIDRCSSFLSNSASLLFVPMTLIAMFEVIMRYLFNRPTIWAWDVNVQLFSLVVAFGAANTLAQGGHVAVDIIVCRFPPKARRLISLCLLGFFVATVGIVAWQSGLFAWRSFIIRERTSTLLAAPIYPAKISIFCGVALLWLQGVSLFLENLLNLSKEE